MSKDTKSVLWILGIIILLSNPALLILGIIGYVVYLNYKGKTNTSKTINNIKEKLKNSDKANNYEVIDTTAEVIDSQIISSEEWKATKEYRH